MSATTTCRALFATAFVALVLSPSVAAHGDGGALGFSSTVTRIAPPTDGLRVRVLQSDDRLEVVNETGRTLVVLGYEGEPYLRFGDGRVFRNTRSPATFLNDDRFGDVEVPSEADPDAQPVWEEVAPRERYEWHDHRIHWMGKELPPTIAATKDEPRHVFDWKVPATIDGERLAIRGSLYYAPPPSGNPVVLIVGFAIALLFAGVVAATLHIRRRARAR